MLSFGSSTQKSAERRIESLNRVLSMLLQGIDDCASHGTEPERSMIQTTLRNFREQFNNAESDEDQTATALAILQAVEDYNGKMEKKRQAHRQDLNGMLSMLLAVIQQIGGDHGDCLSTLPQIEAGLLSAGETESLTHVAKLLDDCLVCLRQRVRNRSVCPVPEPPPTESQAADPVTGLPGPEQALTELNQSWSRREISYMVIFEADRIETINARYGYTAGDQVLLLISQHIAQQLAPGDNLFRWRGPFLVALMERSVPESRITTELQRLASVRLEHAIKIRDREVMVPVSITWNMLPVIASRTPEEVIARADQYMASRMRPVR